MKNLQDLMDYLKTDRMKYVIHLKMLDAYAPLIDWRCEDDGAILLLPTHVNPFDAHTYPQTDLVVMMAASTPAAADRLLDSVPARRRVVFKLVDALTIAAVKARFPVQRVISWTSYTRSAPLPVDPAVVVSTGFDERLMSSFRENGYTREEVERSFQQGSRAFSLFETDAAAPAGAAVPVSTCFIFKNYENIWEIGGLRTLPEFRRRGLGKKVVAAAVNDLLARGLIPRYQVVETNRPSINLAISLGMEPFVTTEHFLL